MRRDTVWYSGVRRVKGLASIVASLGEDFILKVKLSLRVLKERLIRK